MVWSSIRIGSKHSGIGLFRWLCNCALAKNNAMNDKNIESVCVFGSVARSSVDEISDRDVLVVADNSERRKQIATQWCERGWSVATYSPGRLVKMANTGSLFVQHLKLEGEITQDTEGWLQRRLSCAQTKDSYVDNAEASISLALPIERFQSHVQIQDRLIAADLAYVAIRNFGICHFANVNKYVFDYYQIVDMLSEAYNLSDDETRLIKSLRHGKAAYRNGSACSNVYGTIHDVRNVLGKFFCNGILAEIGNDIPVRNLGSGYSTLRDFEASLINHFGSIPASMNWNGDAGNLLKKIRDPRRYSWDIRNLKAHELNNIRTALFKTKEKWCRKMRQFRDTV